MTTISPGEARTFVLAHTPVLQKLRLIASIFELYSKEELYYQEEEEEEEEEEEDRRNTPERYLIGRKDQTFAPDNGWAWDIWGEQQADMLY